MVHSLFAFVAAWLATLVAIPAAAQEDFVKPKALEPGDTIAIVAPAYPLNEGRTNLAIQRLEERGFKIKTSDNLYTRYGYLAGKDEVRAREFMEAVLDPEVDAIFPGTGGYGVSRILDLLDYDAIRAHPKIIIGFSDITGLHLAINARSRLITFHAPNPMWGLGSKENLDPLAAKMFWRALLAESYPDSRSRIAPGWTYPVDEATSKPRTITAGIGRGRLIGGNLSLVAALTGTPYEIETRDRILFLEDINEAPYRIDRMLAQLKLAGKLDDLQGVVLGHWRNCVADEPEDSLTLEQIFDHYFKDRGYPVIAGFPVGHVRENVTLPEGAMAELDGAACRLTVLENPVQLPERRGTRP
jgi:muramoyltetrapeptide carboxypeptidase